MNSRFVRAFAGIGLCTALVCGAITGCGSPSGDTVYVQSVASIVGHGAVGVSNRFAGIVVAGATTDINLDSNMKVDELKVEVGQTVQAGDILFTYDTETMQLSVEQTKLEIENLQNTIETTKSQITDLEKLANEASTSADKLSYTLEIQSLQMQIKENEYNISVKQAELKRQQGAMVDANVKSPISGTVTSINDNSSNESESFGGGNQPYIVISETSNVRVKGTLNELNRSSIYEGTRVTIISRTDSHSRWSGTVEKIEMENNSGSDNQQTVYDSGQSDEYTSSSKYPFFVSLDTNEGLFLGQHVYIQVGEMSEEDESKLMIPSYFINDAESGAWVWAASKGNKLEKRAVELSEYLPDLDAYVISSGLSTSDSITVNDEGYKEGMKVTVMDSSSFSGDNTPDTDMSADLELPQGDMSDGGEVFIDDGGMQDMPEMPEE
ncbi:MAG: efflux RND transporter periplasmic adaptor subunit [Oscillospiraceae bacterium]|nr:efflux RND transporter periplasmic adaptor subunit [Oscillospiraceae bacterium]